MRRNVYAVTLASLLVLAVQPVYAIATISLTDGSSSVIAVDGDADGIVTYNGALGSTVWTVNVTTGISLPAIGSSTEPEVNLNSVNVTSTGGGDLWLMMSEKDFTAPLGGNVVGDIGGTTDGIIAASVFTDVSNTFVQGSAITSPTGAELSIGTFGPGAFAATNSSTGPLTGPFALSAWVKISHASGGQVSSFDFEARIEPVPLPATFILLATGLGMVARRFHVQRLCRAA